MTTAQNSDTSYAEAAIEADACRRPRETARRRPRSCPLADMRTAH